MPESNFRKLYNHNIRLIEAALPYISSPARKSMHLLIKTNELVNTLQGVNTEDELSACDLNGEPADVESMLVNIKDLCSTSEQDTVDMILNFIKAKRLYSTYRSYMITSQGSDQNSNNTPNPGTMMDFLMTQLTSDQKANLETMNMMLNTMNP